MATAMARPIRLGVYPKNNQASGGLLNAREILNP
jgi:hypothetical protein